MTTPRCTSWRPAGRLKSTSNHADWLPIGPQAFLEAAQPLVDLRRSQDLLARAVSIEEMDQVFGYGELRPETVKEFLEYAYHHW